MAMTMPTPSPPPSRQPRNAISLSRRRRLHPHAVVSTLHARRLRVGAGSSIRADAVALVLAWLAPLRSSHCVHFDPMSGIDTPSSTMAPNTASEPISADVDPLVYGKSGDLTKHVEGVKT